MFSPLTERATNDMDSKRSFGPFTFDTGTQSLWRAGTPIALGSRAASILTALISANGEVVRHSQLLSVGWQGAIVEDSNLAVQIASLRRILGPREDGEEWIATVPRVGYRLSAPLSSSVTGKPSLAVLPFENMSPGADQAYVADGLVEDLITAFARFRSFAVIARHSAFAYKGKQFDIRDAARSLGVRYIVEGSVRRAGEKIRISVQLIDGASGEHIWAEKLDGPVGELFDFQDRITRTVVGFIEPEIRQAEIDRARRKHPQNLDAYDYYWRALPLLQTAHGQGYHDAVEMLDRAVALEPGFATFLATAAYAHDKRRGKWGSPPGVDDNKLALDLSDRAMVADSNDPFVLLVAGVVMLNVKRDGPAGLALARRAYELNPNAVLICNITAYLEWAQGNFDKSIACAQHGLKLSPGVREVFWSLSTIARAHLSAGRFEEALVWAQRSLEANPQQDQMHAVVAAAYALLGQVELAERSVAGARDPNLSRRLSDFGQSSHVSGDRYLSEGLAMLETLRLSHHPIH